MSVRSALRRVSRRAVASTNDTRGHQLSNVGERPSRLRKSEPAAVGKANELLCGWGSPDHPTHRDRIAGTGIQCRRRRGRLRAGRHGDQTRGNGGGHRQSQNRAHRAPSEVGVHNPHTDPADSTLTKRRTGRRLWRLPATQRVLAELQGSIDELTGWTGRVKPPSHKYRRSTNDTTRRSACTTGPHSTSGLPALLARRTPSGRQPPGAARSCRYRPARTRRDGP